MSIHMLSGAFNYTVDVATQVIRDWPVGDSYYARTGCMAMGTALAIWVHPELENAERIRRIATLFSLAYGVSAIVVAYDQLEPLYLGMGALAFGATFHFGKEFASAIRQLTETQEAPEANLALRARVNFMLAILEADGQAHLRPIDYRAYINNWPVPYAAPAA